MISIRMESLHGYPVTTICKDGVVIRRQFGTLDEDEITTLVREYEWPVSSVGRRTDNWTYLDGSRPGRKPAGYVREEEEEL